jgi:hypothetical protein
MFLNEIDVSNSLSRYKKKGLLFDRVILEDGYKEYLQLHYQELIFEHHQRKSQGAFYTKLNVTAKMWEMIQKHINIKEYYIWDPCCGTGNLFKDTNNEVFDFLDKDRLYLSDIDETAVKICKQDKGFNASNVFGFNYQNTIPNFIDEHCFQFDYQNTVVDNFVGMPTELQKIIKEKPEKLFVVCNPPYLFASGANNRSGLTEENIISTVLYKELKKQEWLGYGGNWCLLDLYRQFMIWTNEQQIKNSKKCYIVPINWVYIADNETAQSLNKFRKALNQKFYDAFVISNCEFDNVNRFDPIGVFLVGNDIGEYSWKDLKIPVMLPEDEKNKIKFEKEMNKINKQYNLKKHLPKLQFKFDK